MSISISKALTLQKVVRARLCSLQGLRDKVSTEEHYYGGDGQRNRETKPLYDLKALDKVVVQLERYIFDIDVSIKEANATTKIDVDVNEDLLFGALT